MLSYGLEITSKNYVLFSYGKETIHKIWNDS